MNNRSLVRTDYFHRFRVFVDVEARVFDAFRVELLEQTMHVTAATVEDAWREALDVVTFMRAEYDRAPVRAPQLFAPFAIITAVEHARESTKLGVRNNMIVDGCHDEGHPLHDERVKALVTALDQIDFLRRQPQVH